MALGSYTAMLLGRTRQVGLLREVAPLKVLSLALAAWRRGVLVTSLQACAGFSPSLALVAWLQWCVLGSPLVAWLQVYWALPVTSPGRLAAVCVGHLAVGVCWALPVDASPGCLAAVCVGLSPGTWLRVCAGLSPSLALVTWLQGVLGSLLAAWLRMCAGFSPGHRCVLGSPLAAWP